MSEDLCFVAIHNCGGWQAVSVISPERKRDNRRHVAEWAEAGLRIETWTVERFRKEAVMCKCLEKQQTAKNASPPLAPPHAA